MADYSRTLRETHLYFPIRKSSVSDVYWFYWQYTYVHYLICAAVTFSLSDLRSGAGMGRLWSPLIFLSGHVVIIYRTVQI